MSEYEEMDEGQPYLDVAEVGTLGSVLVYTCTACDHVEHVNDNQEPAKILDAGPCPKCGGPREIGMHDLATGLNELFGHYVEGMQMLNMIEERIPDAGPRIAVLRAELERTLDPIRRVADESA